MRVGIFFDGKNFYSGWRATAEGTTIDFVKLSEWLVAKVGGSRLWGAYYYTGIETGELSKTEGQKRLVGFLDQLELLRGFFVHRFSRKVRRRSCEKCGAENIYTQEKEVDTTMVADMLRLAAVDAFDAAILASGDSDHVPAVEGVRAIGKQVFVATWGKEGLSARLRKAAFDHIDLTDGLQHFVLTSKAVAPALPAKPSPDAPVRATVPDGQLGPVPSQGVDGGDAEAAFLQELAYAESRFTDGYVGLNYFLRKWKSPRLAPDFQARNRILQKMLDKGKVETFDAPDGNKALRTKPAPAATSPDTSAPLGEGPSGAAGSVGQP